jgi:hypothetical protein
MVKKFVTFHGLVLYTRNVIFIYRRNSPEIKEINPYPANVEKRESS